MGFLKNTAKSLAKKKLKHILFTIMVPWGVLIILTLLFIGMIHDFFTSDTLSNLNENETKQLQEFIQEKTSQEVGIDYFLLDHNHLLRANNVEMFLRYQIANKKVSDELTLEGYKKKVLEYINKTLKPDLQYTDGEIVTVRHYKEKVDVTPTDPNNPNAEIPEDKKVYEYQDRTETTKKTVKLLTYASSIYTTNKYSYSTKTVSQKFNEGDPEKEEVIETTTPCIASQQTVGKQYDKLREILKSYDNLQDDNDIESAVGMIMLTETDKDWNWYFSDSLSGSYFGTGACQLVGVPTELIPYFDEASGLTNVPNWVLAAIAKQESEFQNEVSGDGAYGIMQFQHYDSVGSGEDLFTYAINTGLGALYQQVGITGSADELWSKFVSDPRMQIIAGAYEIRYNLNYVLWKKGLCGLDYNSNQNMELIKWSADENDPDFKEILRRGFACYNGGPGYGMSVNLDNAQNNYPNQVYSYAMEFRRTGLPVNDIGTGGGSAAVEKAIQVGSTLVGRTGYYWGAGRCQSDIDARRFDCSSFVHWCYYNAGVNLGDVSGVNTYTLYEMGTKIAPKDLKRGDLIFFNTVGYCAHVGIYLGNNQFLHCSSSRGVTISDLNAYYSDVLLGGVRIA